LCESAQTPDATQKGGWPNSLKAAAGQDTASACSSPRLAPATAGGAHPLHAKLTENRNSFHIDEVTKNNVVTMVRFAMALMENLATMNKRKCGARTGQVPPAIRTGNQVVQCRLEFSLTMATMMSGGGSSNTLMICFDFISATDDWLESCGRWAQSPRRLD
jgi:hypothetical protein